MSLFRIMGIALCNPAMRHFTVSGVCRGEMRLYLARYLPGRHILNHMLNHTE